MRRQLTAAMRRQTTSPAYVHKLHMSGSEHLAPAWQLPTSDRRQLALPRWPGAKTGIVPRTAEATAATSKTINTSSERDIEAMRVSLRPVVNRNTVHRLPQRTDLLFSRHAIYGCTRQVSHYIRLYDEVFRYPSIQIRVF